MHANTRLSNFTFGFLGVYVPIETWASLPALWSPFYIVDFVAMVLLVWGAWRARGPGAGGSLIVLAAGYGWSAANGWRATFGRFEELAAGGTLAYGTAEMCFVICGTAVSVVGLVWTLALARKARESAPQASV